MKNALKHIFSHGTLSLAISTSLVSASLVLPGCATEGDDEAIGNVESREYTGEELFAAVFFGEGEAATMLPVTTDRVAAKDSLSQLSDEEWYAYAESAAETLREHGLEGIAAPLETSTRSELLNSETPELGDLPGLIIELIGAKDPEFFDRFAEEITSGDHYRVAGVMGESGQLLLGALGELNAPIGNDPGAGQGFCVFVFGGAILVVLAVAAVNVAVAGNAVYNANAVSNTDCWTCAGTSTGLRGQLMVDEITISFDGI
ncbi:MAG: hypothetical protein AB1Z98_16890 [Nannocystaceae bacterium]